MVEDSIDHSIWHAGGISATKEITLSAAETIGNIGNIKSIAFRIKPDSTTEKLMEGAANDKLIHINAGTLTYPEFDNGYVNGVETNVIVADKWQNVTITSSTNVDFSACSLALNNTTVGNFEIEDLRFFTDEKSANWATQYHNQFAKRLVLIETLDYTPVGSKLPNECKIESGTFSIAEDSTSKYILCDGDGAINYSGIDLSNYKGNGYIKQLDGDLGGDIRGVVDDAINVNFANNKLTLTMTNGQKIRNIIIQEALIGGCGIYQIPMIGWFDDDGTTEAYTTLFPLLESFGFKGSYAIVSDWINIAGRVTTAQILEMQTAGHEIVSHSVTHGNLATMPLADAIIELQDSKIALESLGANIYNFSFPGGATNVAVSAEALIIYEAAFGVGTTPDDLPIDLGKVTRSAVDAASLTNLKLQVDSVIANNGSSILLFYSHANSWNAAKIVEMTSLFQYIADKLLTIKPTKEIIDVVKIQGGVI